MDDTNKRFIPQCSEYFFVHQLRKEGGSSRWIEFWFKVPMLPYEGGTVKAPVENSNYCFFYCSYGC